ncbi:type VI secretion system-associated FHA domain protein TagH [Sagittula salina]|nr:type VI secretion system-associated FHA domain protein TagH [Sagittula salina]
MTLLLRIENFDQLENGGPTSLQLDGRSASVGRRASMDWSLPDPSKMISGHHFDITFEDGEYYLTDVSMNGTFVDGQRHRLEGRLHLKGGERLIVGHYIVGVTLQRVGAASQPPVAQDDPWGAFDPTGMQPVSGGRGGAGLDALNDGFVQVQRPAGGMKTETSLQLPMAGAGSGTGGIQTPTGWGQPLPPQPQQQVPGPSEEPFVAYVPTLGQEPDETPPATPLPEASRPAPQPRPSAPPSAEVPYTPTLGQDEAEAPVSYAPDPVAPEAVPAPSSGPPAGAGSGVGTGVVPGMGHDPGAMPGTGGSGPDPQGFAPAFGAPENPEGRVAPPPAPQPNAIPMPRPVPPGPPPAPPQPPQLPQYQPEAAPQAPVGAPADGPRGGDVGPALRAFCEGAGLDPKSVKPEQAVQLMHMLGRCVRVATEESMHMLKARADVKNFTRGGVRTMLSANANNPMKFMPDSQQALELMFVSPRDGFMTGSEAFKDALGDIRQHQEAVFRALQPALAEVFRGLSPEEIEAACESTGSNLLGKRSGKQWPTYVERWDQKAQAGEHGILDAFLQAFARAYAEANKS